LDSRLRRLPGEVHLDERGIVSFRAADSEANEWQSSQRSLTPLPCDSAGADEMPAERVAVARVLRFEVLRAVLADDLDSGIREHLQLVHRHVLRPPRRS